MSSATDHGGQLLGGRYRLRHKLGAGGMGVVYEAWQEDLGRSVAVKLMTGADQESLLRFQREARTAASLGHPHIVQIFDFQTQPHEPPFIVMELVTGQSLRELVKTAGPWDQDRAARLGVQVLSALEAAHRAGILHRDIKPANVLVTRSPTLGEVAKVLDFGIAKLTGVDAAPITQHGSVIGTLAYMSPEQARGEPLDGRSDVYSLAATLFFASTGERALDAPDSGAMFQALVSGRVRQLAALRRDFDPVYCSIIGRGLAPAREARFQSATEMADALTQWLEGRSAERAPHLGPWSPDGRASHPGPRSGHEPRPSHPGPMSAADLVPAQHGASWASEPPRGEATSHLGPVQSALVAAPRPRRGGAVVFGAGLLGGAVVAVFAALAAAGGAYYYLAAEADPASAPAPARSATVHADATDPSAAQGEPGAAPKPTSPRPAGTRAGAAQPTAKPATPPGPSPTAPVPPPSEPSPTAPSSGTVGSSCKGKSDCAGIAACKGGTCVCYGEVCNGICVNTAKDVNNCGGCGKGCPSGKHCVIGQCVTCDGSYYILCGGVCVNPKFDFNNCGACGLRCQLGKACTHGKCAE